VSEPKSASSNKNTAGKLSNSDKSVKSSEGSSNKNTNKLEQQEHESTASPPRTVATYFAGNYDVIGWQLRAVVVAATVA
jgi:hypothetical protein